MSPGPFRRLASGFAIASAMVALALTAGSALGVPTLGFVEDWHGTALDGWGGGALYSNPGTGGLDGGGDGYLLVSTIGSLVHRLGAVNFDPEYNGNWQAAGITQIRLWLNDVNTDEPLEMHVAIGNGANFWHYNTGFVPPEHAWGEFMVDLSSAANWTRIIGTGTPNFNNALQTADRLHIRHDLPPFTQAPDDIVGDVGIDHLLFTNGVLGVPTTPTALRPVELAPPYPNPSRGPVALSVRAPGGEAVKIQVVDVAGRAIRTVSLEGGSDAPRVWVWDGNDDAGHRAAPGAYRVRAFGRSGGMGRSLVRVR